MDIKSLVPFSRSQSMSQRPEEVDSIVAIRRHMNQLFDDLFEGIGLPGLAAPRYGGMLTRTLLPQIDVSENEQEIRVVAELPGIEEKDIEVMLADDILTIRGEKKAEREEKDRNQHIAERSYGSFSRALRLPFTVDPSQVRAGFKNGVLTISIPRPKEMQERVHKIEVKKEDATAGTSRVRADRAAAGDKPSTADR